MTREELLRRAELMKAKPKTFLFGKFKGKTVAEVMEEQPSYLVWAWDCVEHHKLPMTRFDYEDAMDATEDYGLDDLDFEADDH